MIRLADVGKVYRGRNFEVTALDGISLDIPPGQFVSLVGKSGSGKSSLLKILGLVDFDHSGRYWLDGSTYHGARDTEVARARKCIGYVFQDFRLIGRHTIWKNLQMAAVIREGHVDVEEIRACLDRVDLADKALSYPDELSGGQKQRAAVGRAIVGRPRLLIADEPTGSLDQATATQIMSLLTDLHTELGCTLVLVTHDMDIAMQAERVVELRQGRIHDDFLH
ncbi:MAG: ABC transporter ATP-binding protein [Propionibacteriaceae bacterium]|nr:ABC transporter ATP-binding protein [Propionibacteriaceae bacterium]